MATEQRGACGPASPGASDDAAHVSTEAISALEGLVASLGPAHIGDSAAILLAGLHTGAAATTTRDAPGPAAPAAA